jgi:hypothetical protein
MTPPRSRLMKWRLIMLLSQLQPLTSSSKFLVSSSRRLLHSCLCETAEAEWNKQYDEVTADETASSESANGFLVSGFIISVRNIVTFRSFVRVAYKTGFGLNDWIYWHLMHSQLETTRNYSAIAYLHSLQLTVTHVLMFSMFTGRILATDLSQSHCHFKSQMESPFHNLIPFLPLFCNCQLKPVPLFRAGWRPETRLFTSDSNTVPCAEHFIVTTLHGPHGKHILYC